MSEQTFRTDRYLDVNEPEDREEMIRYINYFNKDYNMKNASEEEIQVFRKYVDQLCREKDPTALSIKAYACYGGNRAYPCNWIMSRNLLLELMKIDENPFVANTLGYIFYYGRCNDGVPEYDKAFYYYSIGAAGGVYESNYKLADMFRKGYGVPKNQQIGESIIKRLYEENLEYTTKGLFDTKFADISLRMGNLYADSEGNKDLAYFYYLQAEFAIRMRSKVYHYYGDEKVASVIRKSIKKVLPETGYEETTDKIHYYTLSDLLEGSYNEKFPVELTLKKEKGGRIKAKVKLLLRDDDSTHPKFFLTVPEAHFCGMVKTLNLTLPKKTEIYLRGKKFKGKKTTIIFNESYEDMFYLNGELVAEIFGEWNLKLKVKKNPKTYRFAAVAFSGAERTYEFLCTDPEIHEGDWVYVEAGGQTVKGYVTGIIERCEYEMPHPAGMYRKVFKES